MSQLRLNPLTGRWVTIVAERAERPTDFAPRVAQVESDPDRPCPFCPGNEEVTLPALETVDKGGTWRMRVIPNLYPAFDGDQPFAVHHRGPVHVEAEASGTHEVFVLTRDHNSGIHAFSDADAAEMMLVLKRRFLEHAATANVRYTQAIINHGREAGASIAHPHGQLLGLPFVPGELLEEQRAFSRFEGGCILCATVEAEIGEGERVLFSNDDVLFEGPLASLVAKATSDQLTSWHSWNFNLLLALAGVHVIAVLYHAGFMKENLIGAMFTGVKHLPSDAAGGVPARFVSPWRALFLLALPFCLAVGEDEELAGAG